MQEIVDIQHQILQNYDNIRDPWSVWLTRSAGGAAIKCKQGSDFRKLLQPKEQEIKKMHHGLVQDSPV